MSTNNLWVSSSPHIFARNNIRAVMLVVIIALLPAAVYGVWLYGIPAFIIIITSILSCVLAEFLFDILVGKKTKIADCSAILSGLLLAMILPPSTPWWMVIAGGFFAMIVAKGFFGGLGSNPFNPALIGRSFLFMSFPAALTTWHKPFGPIDVVTTSTPLNLFKYSGSLQLVADSVGANDLGGLYLKLFMGARAGCIGESSIMLLLLGGLFLLAIGVIQWITPVAMMATTVIVSWLFGVDPVFSLLSGGLVLGAIYMATDYSTSPLTPLGKLLFGVGAGLITSLIRNLGDFPEGVTFGILIMNSFTPLLDKLRVKKYGKTKLIRIPNSKGSSI